MGSDKTVPVDVRLVAATNQDLQELVEEGSFREDLYYRLSVFTIRLPPLRERPEEIPLLAHHFVEGFADEFGKEIRGITPQAMAVLEAHDWPGNVRELENVLERAVLLADDGAVTPHTIPLDGHNAAAEWDRIPDTAEAFVERKKELRAEAVERVERLFVLKALRAAGWNVSEAARNVGMQRTNLHALMRKYGITTPDGDDGDDDA